jgi:hypothetical protein
MRQLVGCYGVVADEAGIVSIDDVVSPEDDIAAMRISASGWERHVLEVGLYKFTHSFKPPGLVQPLQLKRDLLISSLCFRQMQLVALHGGRAAAADAPAAAHHPAGANPARGAHVVYLPKPAGQHPGALGVALQPG